MENVYFVIFLTSIFKEMPVDTAWDGRSQVMTPFFLQQQRQQLEHQRSAVLRATQSLESQWMSTQSQMVAGGGSLEASQIASQVSIR